MSTAPESTPPPPSPPPPPPDRSDRDLIGMGFMPGNAELLVWIIALFVAMLVSWIADELSAASWFDFFQWSLVAYILSRGIAKASRVFEY
jgi:hypothetical protein